MPSWDLRHEKKHPRKMQVEELPSGRQSDLQGQEAGDGLSMRSTVRTQRLEGRNNQERCKKEPKLGGEQGQNAKESGAGQRGSDSLEVRKGRAYPGHQRKVNGPDKGSAGPTNAGFS